VTILYDDIFKNMFMQFVHVYILFACTLDISEW